MRRYFGMTLFLLAVFMAVAALAGAIYAQGYAVGYDPEIGTVMDGVVHDVRVTVSHDRRYVQIDIHSGMSIIEDIEDFVVVTGGLY